MFTDLIESSISRQNLKSTVWKAKALPAETGVYALLHRDSGKIYIGSAAGRGMVSFTPGRTLQHSARSVGCTKVL